MTKYWAENKQVQAWGIKIFKIVILGTLALLVLYIGIEAWIDFIKLADARFVPARYCTIDCSVFWMITLFGLLSISIIGLLLAVWTAPKGFWLNFLLVVWGFLGVMYISDAWEFSWQPGGYYGAYPDNVPTYMGYITRNLLYWIWCVVGVAQIYLPKRIRRYVMWAHCSITAIMIVGGVMINMYTD